MDSTGIKFLGDGEWQPRKHGDQGRRQWRKVHPAMDTATSDTGRSASVHAQGTQKVHNPPQKTIKILFSLLFYLALTPTAGAKIPISTAKTACISQVCLGV